MDDRTVVAALVAGDPRGLDGAYRAYADRLFTYCRFLLRDADAAADAVHDTFVLAGQRAAQLRDPDRLRPWLYAIARNECLRVMRGRQRHLPLEEAGQLPAASVDPVTGLSAEQIRELVWAAAAGLNPGDRQVFELSIRHELSAAEVGAVLGVSDSHAHARLSRVRAQLERAVGALLVARTGTADCADLAGLLRGWDGTLTVLLRKRVSRHVDGCTTCADRRRQQVHPAALFSAYATLPLLAVPADLWPRLVSTHTDPAEAAARARIDRRAGRFDPATGFPRRSPGPPGRRTTAVVAAAGVLALLLGGAVMVPRLGAVDDTARSAPEPPPTLAAPVSAAPTSTAGPTSSAVPTASAPPTSLPPSGGPRPSDPAPPAPPLTVAAEVTVTCTGSSRYRLRVVATVAGGLAESAVLTWTAGGGDPSPSSNAGPTTAPTSGSGPGGPGGLVAPGSQPARGGEVTMTVTGETVTGQVEQVAVAAVTWRVTVVDGDGRQAGAGPYPVTNPCPPPG
ncbi:MULTISPECIES: RNA polymerase sigma factor [unclassified Solwaraspora]|uniref:RNA polymerase sigma factor n=1 Tax=unclassified Solwaraspora TaxID=2627926 RepID=UPI00259BAAFE|nr:sigma-70 family RNA polymerase sigma factor [Solwaraspora sp. WMMA2056]WJK40097.1 sigma-70 family RNA polymerase sigma factor [Solwaraspora sp. WMMA2056]